MSDPRRAVARKRDGHRLTAQEIEALVMGYAREEVPDYLAAAFLMAAYIRGLDADETSALTRAMVDSGITLPMESVSRPKIDKHSTGGVADGVTLAFAPLAASMGLAVAKLSGRGLGHTGGTLDKLESIPGFRTDLEPEAFERQVEEIGCAVAAQSANLVPADGALYALRDATETVPSIPLIAASVMSKKLAVGSDLILLDVKAGSGAFMKTSEEAAQLAEACARLARDWGRPCRAAITDMSQPLGEAVGNALDVVEAIEVLRGDRRGRLTELTLELVAAGMEALQGESREDARGRAERAIASGDALNALARMIEAQGGDPRVVDDPVSVLPRAPVVRPLPAADDGTLAAVDAEAVGRAAASLGAGRARKGDPIDHSVGIVLEAKIGDEVARGQPIGSVHARDEAAVETAVRDVNAALTVQGSSVQPPPLVYGWRDA